MDLCNFSKFPPRLRSDDWCSECSLVVNSWCGFHEENTTSHSLTSATAHSADKEKVNIPHLLTKLAAKDRARPFLKVLQFLPNPIIYRKNVKSLQLSFQLLEKCIFDHFFDCCDT